MGAKVDWSEEPINYPLFASVFPIQTLYGGMDPSRVDLDLTQHLVLTRLQAGSKQRTVHLRRAAQTIAPYPSSGQLSRLYVRNLDL